MICFIFFKKIANVLQILVAIIAEVGNVLLELFDKLLRQSENSTKCRKSEESLEKKWTRLSQELVLS